MEKKKLDELVITNKDLAFQKQEKKDRAAELAIANKKLLFQNEEKKKRVKENKELEAISNSVKQGSQYARSLIEASLDPLVTISPEGKITDVNEASVKVTGVPRLQLIGTDFSDYFTEPEKAREGYKQVFEKEFVSDYPLTIHHKNGKLTDVLYNASVYKDEKGNVLGVFAAARDVTTQKQVSQYARSLIEASLDPLVTISPEGKIMDVNEASVKVTGVPRLQLIGTDFSNYFTEPEKAREGYKQVFEKEFVSDYPLTIHHKNGTLTDVLYNASVYKDEKGNVLGVFAAARDVTAKKAEELSIANKELILQNKEKEKQAAVLEIANKELKFQNEEKEKRAAELIIANKELAFQNEEKENRAAELVIANKELLFQNEEKENRAAELIIANKELAFQNKEKEKRAEELVFANRELKQAEDDIRKLNDELEHKVIERTAQLESVNKELGSFSYSVSHDLRAPIRAINGYSKILVEDYGEKFDADGKKVLHSIMHNSKKMGDLIDDLLAFSKLGRKEVSVSDINMTNLVKLVREELIFDEGENLPVFTIKLLPAAKGDQSLIKQVWINLISNAIKYSKYKPITNIEIGAYEKANLVVYFVKDEGAGFDMQYYDKLFGVFQRLHSQEEFEGTGIGLAIVQKIVHRHGGTVWAESTLNEGTCFYFSLPALTN
ncbi:MAG: PAS domain S-box protein [Bacteroidota bacterium]|nr:PAS domain S-box protein [Bacteroidota bacterium]